MFHDPIRILIENHEFRENKETLPDFLEFVYKFFLYWLQLTAVGKTTFSSISCNIFISTRRMTLIFLLAYCSDSEECFSYLKHVFKMISHRSTAIWSKSFWRKVGKSGFRPKCTFWFFSWKLLFQMAVDRWEIILKTC